MPLGAGAAPALIRSLWFPSKLLKTTLSLDPGLYLILPKDAKEKFSDERKKVCPQSSLSGLLPKLSGRDGSTSCVSRNESVWVGYGQGPGPKAFLRCSPDVKTLTHRTKQNKTKAHKLILKRMNYTTVHTQSPLPDPQLTWGCKLKSQRQPGRTLSEVRKVGLYEHKVVLKL